MVDTREKMSMEPTPKKTGFRQYREEERGRRRERGERTVGDHRNDPYHAFLSSPSIPDQRARPEDRCYPRILLHPVFGPENQLALRVVPACLACFAVHDIVDPAAAEYTSQEISGAVGDIQQTDDESGEAVRLRGECGLHGDVEYVQCAKRDAGVVH
jgi:hypothetical protein